MLIKSSGTYYAALSRSHNKECFMMAYANDYIVSVISNGKPLRETSECGQRIAKIPFDDEYKIRIKNKNPYLRSKVKIFIDGMNIFTKNESLILRPNQSVDLERFVDSLNHGKRFKFVSLEKGKLDGSIQDPTSELNGRIRVEFYSEDIVINNFQPCTPIFDPIITCTGVGPQGIQGAQGITGHIGMQGAVGAQGVQGAMGTIGHCGPTYEASASAYLNHQISSVIPNGATAEGSESSQKFYVADSFPILPVPTIIEIQLVGYQKEIGEVWDVIMVGGNAKQIKRNNTTIEIDSINITNNGSFSAYFGKNQMSGLIGRILHQ